MGIPVKYIAKKLATFFITFFGAITLNFILPRLMPGNPAEIIFAKLRDESGGVVNLSYLHQMEAEFGVYTNKPLWSQYITYLNDLFHGNLGISIAFYPTPVAEILRVALPWTLFLVIASMIISFFIGNRLGRYAGINRNTRRDFAIDLSTMFLASFPAFIMGFLLLDIFAVYGKVLPLGEAYSTTLEIGLSVPFIISVLYHAVLPVATIFLTSLGGWVIGMRNNIIPNVNSDYIGFSRSLGMTKGQIKQIAYRNALLPNLTGFAMSLGLSVSGVLIEEEIFSYPGVGMFMVTAIGDLDYPLIQGIFLMVIIAVLVGNLIVDLLYGFLDPRIKQEGA